MILTVAQQKGGAGKTTLLVQLATLLARDRAVALVDIDPQASLAGWVRLREHGRRAVAPMRLSMIGGWRLAAELDRLRREAECILIDTAAHADTEAKVAIRAADLVLVPMQPSPADHWATRATVQLAAKEGRSVRVMLNRVPPRGRAVDDALRELEREGWPLAATRLGNRQSYVTSFARGLGVVEHEPRSAAADEVQALERELLATAFSAGHVPAAS